MGTSAFTTTKAKKVLAALMRIGWIVARQTGSHKVLKRPGYPSTVFSFDNGDELGPVMLNKIAKATGLTPEDL